MATMRQLFALALLGACHRAEPAPAEPVAARAPASIEAPASRAAVTPTDRPAPAEPPAPTEPPAPPGVIPPGPDAELAALPTDVRLDRAAWLAAYRKDCRALAASPCELVADLDGDGKDERVVEIRAKRGKQAGIAVLWGDGGVSVIAAGAPSRQLRTEVYVDSVDLQWQVVEQELSFVEHWRVAPREREGFATRPPGGGATDVLAAPSATGAGLWLDGGDAAEVLYWDGARWRRLVVGF